MSRAASAALAVALGLVAAPALAASPQVEEASKVFKAVAADPAKLKTFCEMSKAMSSAGDKEDAAADAKIDAYMKQLGADFQKAWNAGADMKEETADGKAYNDAVDALTAKCS